MCDHETVIKCQMKSEVQKKNSTGVPPPTTTFFFPCCRLSPHTSFVLVSKKLGQWHHFPLAPSLLFRIGHLMMELLPPTRSWMIGWTCWSWSSGRSLAAALLSIVWQGWEGERLLSERLKYSASTILISILHVFFGGVKFSKNVFF